MVWHHFHGKDVPMMFGTNLLDQFFKPNCHWTCSYLSSIARAENKVVVDERNGGFGTSVFLSYTLIVSVVPTKMNDGKNKGVSSHL
jgi:hypothetical protein